MGVSHDEVILAFEDVIFQDVIFQDVMVVYDDVNKRSMIHGG